VHTYGSGRREILEGANDVPGISIASITWAPIGTNKDKIK